MPAAYERCLRHVRGKVKSPHAVCTASNAGNVKQHRRAKAKAKKRQPRRGSMMDRVAHGGY